MLSPMERVIHLKKIPLFSELQVRELTAIGSIAEEKTFPAGSKIIQEGDVGDSLYLVLKGMVSVVKGLGSPDELQLAEIGPDDYFGDIALFDRQPRSATVLAREETEVLELSRFEFEEIMREFPQIAIHACRVFSRRVRELQVKVQGE
jgi:CRP-like cAMP-binding protein